MTSTSFKRRAALILVAAAIFAGGSSISAAADEPRSVRPAGPRPSEPARPAPLRPGPPIRQSIDGRGQVLDSRYNHGRYYAPVGTVARSLPYDYRPYYHRGSPYYFSGGVWYAPRGPGFVVIAPPPGLVISVLPPYYSTVWYGGVPYYYADNVYYTAQPDQSGYAVVAPPPDAAPPSDGQDAPQGAPPAPTEPMDLIIYPKNGQSKDQQAADQYECHNWAKGQTGFDPTQQNGGVSTADSDRSHSNYDRAMSACLQGRGYQVN